MRDIARAVKQLPGEQQDRAEAFLRSYLQMLDNDAAKMHRETVSAIGRRLSR